MVINRVAPLVFLMLGGVLNGAPAELTPHDIHSSMVIVEYVSGSQMMKLTVNCFSDDMEKMLTLFYKKEVRQDDDHLQQLMAGYIEKHLQLVWDNGQKAKLQVRGSIQQEGVTSFEFVINNVPRLQYMTIENTIAMEVYDDQWNMVQITEKGNKKVIEFSRKLTKQKVEL